MSTRPHHSSTERTRNHRSNIALAALIAGTLLAAGWPTAAAADECAPEDIACVAETTPPVDPPSSDLTTPPVDPPSSDLTTPPVDPPSSDLTTPPVDPPSSSPPASPAVTPTPTPSTTPSSKPTTPAVTAVKVTGKPSISGTLTSGKTIKAAGLSGLHWNPGGVKVTYRWLVDGKSRSTKTSFTLQDKDAGLKVILEVTGAKSGYTSASTKSAPKAVTKLTSTTALTMGYLQAHLASSATVKVKAATLAPVGTVSIRANGKVVGSAKLKASSKGKATVKIRAMAAGKYTFIATFDGSDQIKTSKSDVFLLSLT